MDGENEDESIEQGLEKEAREMGWRPLDEFKGNKDKWVSAEEYVERGRSVLPIVKATNKRLSDQVSKLTETNKNLEEQLTNTNAAIERLEKHWSEANRRAVESAQRQLKEDLKKAREDNDFEAEEEIREKLEATKEALKESEKKVPEKKTPEDPPNKLNPELVSFMNENKWFGGESKEDRQKTKMFNRLAEDLREDGETAQGREFLDIVLEKFNEQNEDDTPTPRKASKVEGTPSRASNGSSGGKGYASLPSDAKKACDADIETFVGPNKRYKTKDEWRAQYAKIYYSSEA